MKYFLYLSIFLFPLSCIAQEAFDITNNQVRIVVDERGKLSVTEILDVRFKEPRRGIIREIPFVYTVAGERYETTIDNIQVPRFQSLTTFKKADVNIRIGNPDIYVEGDQKYTINYDVSGAVVPYDDHDEFYWNVVPFNSNVSVDIASFSIQFPSVWSDSLYNYVAFTGTKGGKESDIVVNKQGANFTAATTKKLEPYQGVTFAVRIPKGLITNYVNPVRLTGASKIRHEKPAWLQYLLILPLGLASWLYSVWRSKRRVINFDSPTIQYFPPENFTPAEVGGFYDYHVHMRDVISLLPYWGEMGYINIKPLEGSGEDMYFVKKKDLPADVQEYEVELFEGLFEESDLVLLSDLKDKFAGTFSKTMTKVDKAVKQRPLYSEDYKRVFHSPWMIAGFIFSLMMGIVFFVIGSFFAGAGMILLSIAFLILRLKEPVLSERGAQIKGHLHGLYEWLQDPEPTKLNEIMSQYPNYLFTVFPYAIAFGLDKTWQKRMDDMHVEPPSWYDTSGMTYVPTTISVGHMMRDMRPREIAQVFASRPVSTTSGGNFSGGGGFSGSSGGGMGGGSVSSW